jgi:hypothetical protein
VAASEPQRPVTPTNAQPATKQEDTLLEVAGEALEDSLTDVIDTVRAVAEVMGQRIGASVQEFRDQVADLVQEEEEVTPPAEPGTEEEQQG